MIPGKQGSTTLHSITRNSLNALLLSIALLLAPIAYATNITSVISMLLLDSSELRAAYQWNGQTLASSAQPNVDAGSINTLTFDTSGLPQEVFENLQSIDISLIGECYQIGGETLDPTIYEWSIISTGSGQCKIKLIFTAIVNGQPTSNDLNINITMDPAAIPPPSIETLVSGADLSEGDAKVAGIFSISSIQKWTAPVAALRAGQPLTATAASAFPDSYTPSIYEFQAMHNGVALKGVMLSTRKLSDPRNINDFDMDARTTVRFVGTTPVLVGSGVVQGMPSSPDNTFAFLAVADGVSLPGPAIGDEFHIDGKNALNVLCADQRLAGFGKFSVKRTGTRIASSLVGFTNKDCSSSGGRFRGTAGVFSDFQVVNTHIGRVLRGRGTASPLHNGQITTVADMDESDPDYALYMLGVPERLSSLHAITPVDAGTAFKDNVFILDPFTLSKIAKIRGDSGTMIFSEPPEQLVGISIGDIIVGKSSARLRDGLLREVTQKGTLNGKFYLQTRQASLAQLFKSGGISLQRGLKLGDIEEEGVPVYANPAPLVAAASLGATRQQAALAPARPTNEQLSAAARAPYNDNSVSQARLDVLPFPSISFDHVFSDRDGNTNTTNDQIRTEGIFDLDAFITLKFKCGLLCTDPSFEMSFTFEEDFELSGHAFVTGFQQLDLKEVLKTKKFAPIWIGPVAITPKINLAVHMNGSTDTNMTWGIDQTFDATLGMKLANGVWSEISTQNDSIVAAPLPGYSPDSGTVDLRARASVEGIIKVMGIKVGGADAGIYTDVEAATPRDPLWEITAGLNSEAFVEVDLVVVTLEAGPWELFNLPFPITGGTAPNQPPRIDWIKVDGILVENGAVHSIPVGSEDYLAGLDGFYASAEQPIRIKVKAFDPEFSYACCNVELSSSKDGVLGLLDETNLSLNDNYVFPINLFSTGSHTMTVKVWEKNKAKSTAIIQTFTMQGRVDYAANSGCQNIEIERFSPSPIPSGYRGFITLKATISGYAVSCFPSGMEIEWMHHTADLGYSPAIETDIVPSYDGVTHAFLTSFYGDPVDITLAARFKNNSGVWKYSNDIRITLLTFVDFGNLSGSTGGGIFGASQAKLARSSTAPTQPPLLAPTNTSIRKLGLDNWAVGEAARFDNPFDDGPGGRYQTSLTNFYNEIRWIITDNNASVTVNAQGKAQIIPATSGWHRIMVALVNTNTGHSIRKSAVFYVAPGSGNTWRGYSQDNLLQDIEKTRIPVDNGEMISGAVSGANI